MNTARGVEEKAIAFPCGSDTLVGVVSLSGEPSNLGVVIIVGGPQYRAGSHRQFVSLARHLAAAGFPTLRFDYRGMGDSSGERRSFEDIGDDARAAIDALFASQPGLRSVALWGLCDAASAAMLYAPRDARVSALMLANPWARGEETFARAQVRHYYFKRLASFAFWKKAIVGRLRIFAAASEFLRSAKRALGPSATVEDYRQRMMAGLEEFAGPVLLFISGRDLTSQEFLEFVRTQPAWRALAARSVREVALPEALHTFPSRADKEQVEQISADWLKGVAARSPETSR